MKKLILTVLMLVMLAVSCMAQKTTTSSIPADDRSVEEKLKDGCEMTVCIKHKKVDYEMIVKVKNGNIRWDQKDIEQAIYIKLPKALTCVTSNTSKDNCNDKVLYIKGKEKNSDGLWRWYKLYRRIKRLPPDYMK